MDLSVVVITKNEQRDIPRCLEAVSWCDDVLVVDDYSDDDTRRIAERLGARVLLHRFESFARQRNWALEHGGLRHSWVLMLDADEVVTEPLRDEIEAALASADDSRVGYLICRKTMFAGCWLRYSDGFPVWIMRLVRRGRARFADSGHGEQPVPPVDGTLGTLRQPMLHYPFSKGLSHWIDRHNRYSTLEANLEANGGVPPVRGVIASGTARQRSTLRAISRRLPLRPLLRFLYQFVVKGGFLDGRAGFTFCCLMAAYEGLIVLKRWEKEVVGRRGSL